MIFDDDGDGANLIWAMQDRNAWDAARSPHTGVPAIDGYGHYESVRSNVTTSAAGPSHRS